MKSRVWGRLGLGTLLVLGACTDDIPALPPAGSTGTGETEVGTPTEGPTGESTSVGPGSGTGSTSDTTGPADTTADDSTTSEPTSGESTASDSTGPGVVCGDDVVGAGEQCDGNDLGGEDCISQGFDAGELACAGDCTFDATDCVTFTCGNDVIEGAEACDGVELAGEDCLTQGFDAGALACAGDCTLDTTGCVTFMCGNDLVEGAEACDGSDLGGEDCLTQGFDAGMIACAGDCSLDTSGCVTFMCGNGMIEGMEACDGVDLGGQTCIGQGFDAGMLGCTPGCAFDTSGCVTFTCGNGVIEGMESCDGADLGGQTCSSQGFDAGALGCTPGCVFDTGGCITFTCGDGVIQGAEVCDGASLGGESCATQGFDGGVLGCQADCSGLDTSACTNFGGDCCAANGTPGCDDLGCANAVCLFNPSCCNVTWDAACAAAAAGELACQGVGGSCPGGGPVCGNGVVEAGEFCDGADLAGEDCTTLGFAGGVLACNPDCLSFDTSGCMGIGFSGDCCAANGTPGCDDPACTNAICAIDPFCCSNQWDGICANEAIAEPICAGAGGSCGAPFACADEDIGSTTGAAVTSGNTGGDDNDLDGSCGGAGGNDRVITFTAPVAGTYTFDTFGSGYDTKLSLFSNCTTEISCNDDAVGLQSQLQLDMAAGQTVLVVVDGFNGATGAWVLNITAPGAGGFACADEDIGSATGAAVTSGNTGADDDDLDGSCGGTSGNDRVVLFTAPAAALFTFDTFGSGYDTKLSLFSDCGSEISCNDDTGGGLQSQLTLNMAAGEQVLVVVDGFNGATGNWVLNIAP
ncbi:hypothetical protein [Paraliomyxa miuraensis]|uniref:hypothetical protein n=1 Tax=Paraliomyxa miuraensis TaxID=376150 RepID=UPI00224E5DB7|nr:hypothetical protein [Paraliomyxa miuraensis]MCX4245515.1 hypothetical protein [Paraliomyxa miuraensis]